MNNYQEVQINIGLNYTDDNGKVGEFDRELGRFLVETKFAHCGIVSEPYQSTWQCLKTSVTYTDKCLAFKITTNDPLSVKAIREKVRSLSVLLKQDATAFVVDFLYFSYGELHYVNDDATDKDEFDPKYFHYVA